MEGVVQAENLVGFFAGEAEGFPGLAVKELQRQDAHEDEVGAVDPLEAGGNDGADAEQIGPFGGPVARAAGAVFGAGENDGGDFGSAVFHRCVVNRNDFANVSGFVVPRRGRRGL